ncbi:hypothetical protein GGR50DRAFT_672034 [Xylaria sp. CBS 124048]|nr:hypothetical protein GGR50DRAFT_672034 [Xylaria sp. CBS 124048]
MDEFDCCYSWQAWKFGMKRSDLNTKLHDQYNTITLAIQDPDAFYHDVHEISQVAADVEEFHQRLEERKQYRLEQLNTSLQSASVEIIANPELIGTDQWQHAIQLFRTRSFDSLVRYFSSYLPEGHQWNASTQNSSGASFFDDSSPMMTHEPLFISTISTNTVPASHLPPSPRSLTMCSDSSSTFTPARSLSFSEPESEPLALSTTLNADYDDELSQSDDPDTPTTPLSETSTTPSEYYADHNTGDENLVAHRETHAFKLPLQDGAHDSTTPTPVEANHYSSPSCRSPTRPVLKSMILPCSKHTRLERRVRERSPGSSRTRRRSPEIGRIQKHSPDPVRIRPRSLKRS